MVYIVLLHNSRTNGVRAITAPKPEAETGIAKLFRHGRSQAVRLPKEFRLPGTEVRVRKLGNAVVLEPIGVPFDIDGWFAALDRYKDVPFMPEGREQPVMSPDDDELRWD